MFAIIFFVVNFVFFGLFESFLFPLIFVTIINLYAIFAGVIFISLEPKQTINAASQIDKYYKLKDRVLTAIQICQKNENEITPTMQLQLEDTANHLSNINPSEAAQLRLTFNIILIFLFALLGYVFGLSPASGLNLSGNYFNAYFTQNSSPKKIKPDNHNNLVQNIVDNIRNKNNNTNSPTNINDDKKTNELNLISQQLNETINHKTQHLTTTSTLPDSIAVLSEMEQAVKQAIAEVNVSAYNFSFNLMAAAFDDVEVLRDVAAAIRSENYDNAAAKLESFTNDDFRNTTQVERRSAGAGLQDAADEMKLRNQNELEQLTRKFADEFESSQNYDKTTADKIAQKYRRQIDRNNLHSNLTRRLAEIERDKLRLIEAYNQELNQQTANDLLATPQNINPENKPNQTTNNNNNNSAGNNRGGSPLGQNPDVADTGKNENTSDISVTKIDIANGNIGDGSRKTIETVSKLGSTNTDNYEYKNLYLQYHKQMESVLELEIIPLERRKTIRKYFETIKPLD
jgi:hypothetical protein